MIIYLIKAVAKSDVEAGENNDQAPLRRARSANSATAGRNTRYNTSICNNSSNTA